MPWAPTVAWALDDAATGGNADEGVKTVTAEYGNAGTWTPAGSDDILFDTTPPEFIDYSIDGGAATTDAWRVLLAAGSYDNGSGSRRFACRWMTRRGVLAADRRLTTAGSAHPDDRRVLGPR